MIQLSNDGPNTSWAVLDLINTDWERNELPKLAVLRSCGLHIVCGAIKDDTISTNWNLDKILIKACESSRIHVPEEMRIYILFP